MALRDRGEFAADQLRQIAERFGVKEHQARDDRQVPVLGCRAMVRPMGGSTGFVADVLRVWERAVVVVYRSEKRPEGGVAVAFLDSSVDSPELDMTVRSAVLVSDRTWRVEMEPSEMRGVGPASPG